MKKLRTTEQTSFFINEKHYDDRVDVNEDISLFEYGILRNSKTDKTIIGVIGNGEEYKQFKWRYIDVEDVKSVLEDIENGFFGYIGTSREYELSNLNNINLAHIINSINRYNGYWLN